METKRINELLERFFDGQTSIAEEQELRAYFASDEIDAELLPYKELFVGIGQLQAEKDAQLEEELMDFILESEHKEKNKLRYLWQAVSAVAAILLITLLVFNYQSGDIGWKDTYKDPDIAYTEASKTLRYVAARYKQGIGGLQSIDKVNQAFRPLDNGIQQVNKGFRQVEELQQINEKLNTK